MPKVRFENFKFKEAPIPMLMGKIYKKMGKVRLFLIRYLDW